MNLKDYIQGKRHGKEANQLEREAMNDPFLQDAIEGFDSVPGDHLPVIEELEKELFPQTNPSSKPYQLWIFGIAASLIFLLGIGTLIRMYNLPENKITQQTAQLENRIEQEVSASEKEIINEPEIKEPKKNIALNIQKAKPDSSKDKDIQVEEEIVVNDNSTEFLVAEVEENTLEVNEVSEMQIAATTQIQMVGSNIIQKTINDKVSGVVLDETGEPLVGVSVKFKNNLNGTVTDLNGRFELVAPKNQNEQLVASYIGYEKKEITVTDDSIILQLKPDNLALNEVVVIGYGGKKTKESVNYNSKAVDVLSGRAAGVEVKQISKSETFGEYEFKKYFEKNRNQTICENKANTLTAVFYVDVSGKPINIKITACSCYELESEFMRLINMGPLWTKVNRNVYITIRLK